MTNRSNVPGPEDEGTVQTTCDSLKYRDLKYYSGLLDIKKSKFNFKFFLVLLLLSYLVGFGWISWVSPILELYGRGEETLYTDISLQTHISLSKQQPLKIQKEIFQSRSDPQPNTVGYCSSLIDGFGVQKVYKTQRYGREILCCDRSHNRTDVCYLSGDLRTHPQSASVFLYSHDNKSTRREKIRPYTRKWESSVMSTIDEVTLRILRRTDENEKGNLCQVQHSVPAVVFSTGGYTGNVYHEFNDGLLPLYITSQHLQGEVVFIVLEYHDWWMMKYREVVKQLSKYPVIDFRGDKRIHCFPEMIVGMEIHDELSVDPSLMKDGKTIRDFQSLLGKAYTPPGFTNMINQSSTVALDGLNSSSASMNASNFSVRSALKPKLVIISRQKSRVILNQNGIVKLAEKIGFEVEILYPQPTTEMAEMFRVLNSCDVMLGVHGAAMTHFLLMRPGSVFIQIVPLGTDWAAATYYGQPAMNLGLKYVEYKIVPEESSLYGRYERNDPVLTDPDSINSKGWWETKKVYLDGQNVRPSLKRLQKCLLGAYAYSLSGAQARRGV